MTDRDVTGSPSALAYLFSGGHAIQVPMGRTKAQRIAHRARLADTWSRAVMAKLPWVAPGDPSPVADFVARPSLAAVVRKTVADKRSATKDFPFDRSEAKRAARAAGYRWKAVARYLRGGVRS